ncbi:MAG: glycosyltransferase family 4 protein [Candidatus Binataceae bacterium]
MRGLGAAPTVIEGQRSLYAERSAVSRPTLLMTIYANPDYYPPTVNAVNLARQYFSVHLLCRNMEPSFRRWPRDVTLERVGPYATDEGKAAMGAAAKLREYWRFAGAVRKAIARIRPHLIYAYDPHAFAAAIWAGAKRRDIPLVYQLHELPESRDVPLRSMQRWVLRYARARTREADLVVFPERNRAMRYLGGIHDARPSMIVPNFPARDFCPPPSDWSALIERRLDDQEILYMGTLGPTNGNREALAALCHVNSPARLTMLGRCADEFRVELLGHAQRLGLERRLSIENWIPHTELPMRARHAALGLSTYKAVSQSLEFMVSATNKLFEYAACAMPVVVPDRPGYREFLAGESWVVYADFENPVSIAQAIDAVFADRERYGAMCVAARRAFEDRYHYERAFAPLLERMVALAGAVSAGD